ncbi:TIGR03905 family TSCPD domain-containing protein [Cetobacterium sp.]|uniref:TIGR03905 family TSCPD domain-containing protein n=1 Tax=Cetobacterium sp. TaxID=2071632 RepID=UPI0025F20AE3|nr:TIGR03905 family TSCPD domain-containing protein [uncultured Cetobacterium sp.]
MKILKTKGVCAKEIGIELNGDIVEKIEFFGGCDGNTVAIEKLVEGMSIGEVIKRLEGIDCSSRGTSCPDQLAKLLRELI